MIRKSFILLVVTAFAITAANAQTPEPKGENPSLLRSFSLTVDGGTGYLGVQTREVTKENFAALGLSEPRGVAVDKVLEGSPAEAAGLREGDVIIRFNGEEVTSSRKLIRLVGEVAPDHKSRITVLRNGRESELVATIGKRPAPQFSDGGFKFGFPEDGEGLKFKTLPPLAEIPRYKIQPNTLDEPRDFFYSIGGSGRRIGVSLTPLTDQLAKHFGVTSGVLVTDVRADSPAEKAGLKAGDIITEADGKTIKGDSDLVKAIAGKKEGDISLTVVRGGTTQTITVTPEESKDGFQRLFKIAPGSPTVAPRPAPLPLNQFLIPGRVI